ncbi:substrate-binding domain-containing protein [Paenarthrobacter sp. RAF9]
MDTGEWYHQHCPGSGWRQGLAVPGDLAVIGHDDDPWGEILVPALSTIRMDVEGLGRLLALTALNAVDGRDVPQGEPNAVATLVRRAST